MVNIFMIQLGQILYHVRQVHSPDLELIIAEPTTEGGASTSHGLAKMQERRLFYGPAVLVYTKGGDGH